MRLPNFILAGTNTAGTTSLYHYLRQHPQIYMSSIKEPTYFAAADMLRMEAFRQPIAKHRDALRAHLDGPQARPAQYWVTAWEDYRALFRNVRGEPAIGEASVSYFWLPSAAAAIRSALPSTRLIFVLRHPADRLFSWYLMNLERDPRLTFRAWFLAARDAGGDGGPSVDRYTLPLDGGWCSPHLERFHKHFPQQQMRFYLYERFRSDARAVLRDVFAFLHVDPDQPIDTSHRVNETLLPRSRLLHQVRRSLLGSVSLTGWLPPRLQRPLQQLYRRRRGELAMTSQDRSLVIEHYREDIQRTADLTGHDLSAWLN